MIWLKLALCDLLRKGKIIVEIQNLDMEEVEKILHGRVEETLREVMDILCQEDLTDTRKADTLAELMQ